MALASFGRKVLSVSPSKTYTLTDLQYESSLDTEKQDSSGNKSTVVGTKLSRYDKPSTYVKGSGLNTLSFKISLGVGLGTNPRKEVEDWESIKDEAVAYDFILGKRAFGRYKWLLVDIQVDNMNIDQFGNMLQADLSLKFDEYYKQGKVPDASSTGTISVADSLLSAVDPTSQKRDNPNMSSSGLDDLYSDADN